jgi:hypothetical protein
MAATAAVAEAVTRIGMLGGVDCSLATDDGSLAASDAGGDTTSSAGSGSVTNVLGVAEGDILGDAAEDAGALGPWKS